MLMKMVTVIYRRSMDNDFRHFLKSIEIKPFTESPTVSGIAETGHAFGSWPGHHTKILSAMEDHQTEGVFVQVEEFRDYWLYLQGAAKIPMRVFAVPWERPISRTSYDGLSPLKLSGCGSSGETDE